MERGNYHKRKYKKLMNHMKQGLPMNPRWKNKPQKRTYMRWGERNYAAKVAIQDDERVRSVRPRRQGERPSEYYPQRRATYERNRDHLRRGGEAMDRWIDQDQRIERWFDA